MDIASGLFALGGVAVAAGFNELRAWRESRAARESAIFELRRETYARALRQIETIASRFAQWAEEARASDEYFTRKRAVWDAMTAAYETLNEVRLIAGDLGQTEDAMNRILRDYRDRLEADEQVGFKSREERSVLVDLFRKDLAIGGASRKPNA
jgi:hypothetical protein